MAKRKRNTKRGKSSPRRWFWLLGAAAGAGAAIYFFSQRPVGRIPVPGESAVPAGKAQVPSEVITDSDRRALDRVLSEQAKPRR